MKKILLLVIVTLFTSCFLFITQQSFAYPECETGVSDGCNPNGQNTGYTFDVINGQCFNKRLEASCVQQVCPGVIPYPECEPGVQNGCNPDGSKTGHNFSVYACRGTWYCVPDDIPGCGLPAYCTRNVVCDTCTKNANTCGPTAGSGSSCHYTQDANGSTNCTSASAPNQGCDAGDNCTSPNTCVNNACTPPTVTKKYKCSNNACVEDDANGTFTDSSCNNSCTPATSQHTLLNLALQLTGIGQHGNLNPQHPTRHVHVQVYKKGDDPTQPNINPIDDVNNTITYNSSSGYFLNSSLDLGTNIPTGDYQILVKAPRYLRKEVVDQNGNNVFTITAGQTTTLPTVKMIAGDIVPLSNTMDIADFNAMVGCYGAKATTSACLVPGQIEDLNDDGVIDGVDINIWLSGMQTLLNNNDPEGNGDGITGD